MVSLCITSIGTSLPDNEFGGRHIGLTKYLLADMVVDKPTL